jgi:hypothetical protein
VVDCEHPICTFGRLHMYRMNTFEDPGGPQVLKSSSVSHFMCTHTQTDTHTRRQTHTHSHPHIVLLTHGARSILRMESYPPSQERTSTQEDAAC